ncbi:unnamed protein product [Plutella xylostella]|uniref:(diamondback moth) hypothetical protein n=1 Tax=Plutella xylostella TaxID=51655 RepID=A0A8S4FAF9_PLUXY|nr:unnamed protein product [Plutella xylostella]
MEPPRGRWLPALVLLCSFVSTHSSSSHSKLHEHLTADELRSVFHVEHRDLVPAYHPVTLTHRLARRHIATTTLNQHTKTNAKTPHEKTRSKPWKTETDPPSLLNDQMFVRARQEIKDVDLIGELNTTVSVNFDVSKSSESDSEVVSDREQVVDGQEADVHKIELEAFGKPLKLVLRRQEGLVKKEGLKMFRAHENDTQPDGVHYEELVSWIRIVVSLTPEPAANSDVVCDGSASTIAFNSSLSTLVSGRPRGLFCRSKFPERKRWNYGDAGGFGASPCKGRILRPGRVVWPGGQLPNG